MLDVKRLILGTVQFGQDYVVKKVQPDEVYKILNYAHDVGIDTLDTAYAYSNYELLSSFMCFTGKKFKIISKVKNEEELFTTLAFFPHMVTCLTHGFDEKLLGSLTRMLENCKSGMSIYGKHEIRECDVLQVPMIKEFLPLLDEHYHLRSIFGRGEKLKDKTVKECVGEAFDTKAGKIVIGVDSLAHLTEIVNAVE